MTESSLDPEKDARYMRVQAERYDQSLASFCARLRDVADRIEREGTVRVGHAMSDGKPDYLYASQQVLHELHWGIANLQVSNLMSAAADAHSAVRGRIK